MEIDDLTDEETEHISEERCGDCELSPRFSDFNCRYCCEAFKKALADYEAKIEKVRVEKQIADIGDTGYEAKRDRAAEGEETLTGKEVK